MLDKRFSGFENFIFDLDGTVWRWTELIPKTREVFKILDKSGKNVFFLTNNAILTREGFAKKLQNFGINASKSQIINTSLVAIKLFRKKKVFCIGEGIVTELRRAGIKIVNEKPDAVLVFMDRNLTYEKLAKACSFVFEGSELYKECVGGVWFYGKRRIPGAGAIAASIEMCCGKVGELLGKPSQYMIDTISGLSLNPKETVIFGDEHESDIVLGNRLGFETVLVLTGRDKNTSAKGEEKPKMVLKSIADILKV